MSIAHQHFLMSSNGGHLTTMIRYPNPIDPKTVKEGDTVICWDDSGLAEKPHIINTPERGKYYTVREVSPETFGLRLDVLTNPEGPFPMEPGFELSRFSTVDDWESAPLKIVKNYPHTPIKYRKIGWDNKVHYATPYDVSFDDFNPDDLQSIFSGGEHLTTLRYNFEELALNEPLEATSTFHVSHAFGNYNLIKHTQVTTSHLFDEDIESNRLVITLQEVPGVSIIDHAKAMVLLWLLHDSEEIQDMFSKVTLSREIAISTEDHQIVPKEDIEKLLDFSIEDSIHQKVCGLLKIDV